MTFAMLLPPLARLPKRVADARIARSSILK